MGVTHAGIQLLGRQRQEDSLELKAIWYTKQDPASKTNKQTNKINIAVHMHSFQSLKIIDLRTRIDLRRLKTSHVSSCVFLVKGKHDLHRDMLTWVVLVWISLFL